MGKRVRISNNSINSYGTKVLTAGMNVAQYQRNPVLLFMHQRGSVIGYVKDLKVENDEITGELMFDEATELSKTCKKQFEFGSLKMVSAGIDILQLSEDKELVETGQTRPTITRSKLFEVSLVDVGSNDDAIVLMKDGEQIKLGKDGNCAIPLLNINNKTNQKQMDQKVIALQLGLSETATEQEINSKLNELKTSNSQVETLKKEKDELTLSAIMRTVDTAIAEKRIGEDRKQQFINLGKNIGVEELKKIFDAMSPQIKLSQMIHKDNCGTGVVTYKKLSEVPEEELEEMREKDQKTYAKLYKAEYGMECEF